MCAAQVIQQSFQLVEHDAARCPADKVANADLEHPLITSASNPCLLAVPSEAFKLGTVWDCNLLAANRTCTEHIRSQHEDRVSYEVCALRTSSRQT